MSYHFFLFQAKIVCEGSTCLPPNPVKATMRTAYLLPELINLEHTEDGNGVHESSIKLEVGMVRTNVITP